jgi:hypothetical protein
MNSYLPENDAAHREANRRVDGVVSRIYHAKMKPKLQNAQLTILFIVMFLLSLFFIISLATCMILLMQNYARATENTMFLY